ncbi:hypothetical protein GE21DRAFT_1221419, partial [Neurospora crassa]
YITLLHLFIKNIRDNTINNNFKVDNLRKNLYQLFINGAKDLVVEPVNNITLNEWLTYIDRRAKIRRLKIIDDLGGYSNSFNKRILKVEFDSKLLNIKTIKAANFVK